MLAMIGGSGVYNIDGLSRTRGVKVDSPFGAPSDELLLGELAGQPLVFLPRHGRGHHIPPSKINFRANIDALKRVGVTQVISVSAVGSLKEELPPGMFVIVDQFIDRTFAREKSFFGTGLVAHASMARPVCARLGDAIETAARAGGIRHVRGGTYLAMEGPQFSSMAESALYRSWHCDVIGMTNMPEAKLAREAELCYATIAMVTDYDCWHPQHDAVTLEEIIGNLSKNAENVKRAIRETVKDLSGERTCKCGAALAHAILTDRKMIPAAAKKRLAPIAGKYLGK